MKYWIAIIIALSALLIKSAQAQNIDTLKIYYDINKSELNAIQKTKIDSFINNSKQLHNTSINIYGFTDYLAGDAYNRILSCKRADNVKSFLIEKGIDKKNIKAIGNGKLPPELKNNTNGIAENRKVEIIVFSIPKKLNELKVGDNIVLKNVNFHPGSHIPLKEALPALDELVKTMKENPGMEIEIQGHVCCTTFEEDGYDVDVKQYVLSVERAKYVYNYLIGKDINESRLSYKGFGGKYRLSKTEATEADKTKNRRVEIKIIKK